MTYLKLMRQFIQFPFHVVNVVQRINAIRVLSITVAVVVIFQFQYVGVPAICNHYSILN